MASTSPEAHFRATAPRYMARLLADFPQLGVLDAAAIFGNLAHESLGFTALQEINPTVEGSRGGWGWAQWTGPRRRAFEAWAKRTGKDLRADETNYAYLFLELKGLEGSESGAIPRVLSADTLDKKVEQFELGYLRAGVKHYDSRKRWAKIALDAYQAVGVERVEAPAAPIPPDYEPPATDDASRPRGPSSVAIGARLLIAALVIVALIVAAVVFLVPRA